MVNMGMAQYDGLELFGIKMKIAIAFDGLITMALEQPAFQQQLPAIYLQEILRSSRGAGGS
jgi:hypothetical protein